ncbi:MAG TPA: hypothetical protein VMT64_08595 [Candidatus Binataceae bacterium]|nr:hypothetical protein [Candidatus Binataceae bacterium]
MAAADAIATELEAFYRRYIEAFNRQETVGFVDYFTHPYAVISGERGVTSVADEQSHRKSFERSMVTLRGRGWVRSGIDSIKAWSLADNLGMIVSDVTRYKADDSVLEKVRACYFLCRADASWKIATITEIRPPHRGPGDVPYP